MTVYRIHSCDSAQQEVFNRLEKGETGIMVHCDHQKKGEGRRQKRWFSSRSAVAMSFDLNPNPRLSLTSLELGVLTCDFLRARKLETYLKWPNDLLTVNGKKCGGILIQSKQSSLVAGIGINLYHPRDEVPEELNEKFGHVFNDSKMDAWNFSQELYQYICDGRLNPIETVKRWNELCGHLQKQVTAHEDGTQLQGKFIGIGQDGEALIETPLEIKSVYNASLSITGP